MIYLQKEEKVVCNTPALFPLKNQVTALFPLKNWDTRYKTVIENALIKLIRCRFVCQDIGGSDPERMAAPRVEEYITELFSGSTTVNVSIGCSQICLMKYN